jgi:hypothetical protein
MDGLSRWDLVLWIVVAYIAVISLVRMMLHHRDVVMRKMRDRLAMEQQRRTAAPAADDVRKAA